MIFTLINKENWDRKEYFEYYFFIVPCTYSMTIKLDITRIKETGKNFIHLCFTILLQL